MSKMSLPMTYIDRAKNMFSYLFVATISPLFFTDPTSCFLRSELGNDFDAMEQISKSALFFVNVDEFVDFPRPISHKVINIGGIGKIQSKPLTQEYENIFSKAKKGVILISFGSVAQSSMMPEKLKKDFLTTFSMFPNITFLWKYENEEENIAEGYNNVITKNWIPQNDLLGHPRLLGFISHAGMNSVQEGASNGVPMICIPLYADQMRNSKSLEYRDMALVLDRNDLTVEILAEAIKKIIGENKYHKNAKRISEMMAKKPISSEERVLKYTEFAAEFGPDLNLDMYGRNLNFIQFYCIDIILPTIFVVLGIIFVVILFFRFMFRQALKLKMALKKKVD